MKDDNIKFNTSDQPTIIDTKYIQQQCYIKTIDMLQLQLEMANDQITLQNEMLKVLENMVAHTTTPTTCRTRDTGPKRHISRREVEVVSSSGAGIHENKRQESSIDPYAHTHSVNSNTRL